MKNIYNINNKISTTYGEFAIFITDLRFHNYYQLFWLKKVFIFCIIL